MVASPDFDVIATEGGVELRRYVAYIVAETDVSAKGAREAASQGFRPLANYIFGANTPKEKIAMTSPVTAEGADETYTVRFSMPPEWTMDTLPEPTDPAIRLVAIDAQDVLATGFRGRSDHHRMNVGATRLLAFAEAKGFEIEGTPAWAGYSSPAVPLPFRRWEMLLRVNTPT